LCFFDDDRSYCLLVVKTFVEPLNIDLTLSFLGIIYFLGIYVYSYNVGINNVTIFFCSSYSFD